MPLLLTSLSLYKGDKSIRCGELAYGNTFYDTGFLYMPFLSIKEKVILLSGGIWRITIILKVKVTK